MERGDDRVRLDDRVVGSVGEFPVDDHAQEHVLIIGGVVIFVLAAVAAEGDRCWNEGRFNGVDRKEGW